MRKVERIKNERISEKNGWRKEIVGREEEGVLKCFGNMCRINENRMVGTLVTYEVENGRGRRRPKWIGIDDVRKTLRVRGLSVEEVSRFAKARVRKRAVVMEGGRQNVCFRDYEL